MSSASQVLSTESQSTVNYDREKIFLGYNEFRTFTLSNDSGGAKTYAPGLVLGQIAVSGDVIPLVATATDGSQFPIGILTESTSLADGDDVEVSVCVAGDVNQNKVTFDGAETLATVVSLKRLDARIPSDTKGIRLLNPVELSGYDNN